MNGLLLQLFSYVFCESVLPAEPKVRTSPPRSIHEVLPRMAAHTGRVR